MYGNVCNGWLYVCMYVCMCCMYALNIYIYMYVCMYVYISTLIFCQGASGLSGPAGVFWHPWPPLGCPWATLGAKLGAKLDLSCQCGLQVASKLHLCCQVGAQFALQGPPSALQVLPKCLPCAPQAPSKTVLTLAFWLNLAHSTPVGPCS